MPEIKTLIIASHNPGKVEEIQQLLKPFNLEILTAASLRLAEPEETGTTFVENAILKAQAIAQESQFPALADDSGLVIPALKGEPGIYSARWAEKYPGGPRDFNLAIHKVGELLNYTSGVQAQMVCALALVWPTGEMVCFEGKVEGTLQFPGRGTNGFGYDPIFQPCHAIQTFGEMEPAIKHSLSHRFHAFQKLTAYFHDNFYG